MRQLPVRKNRKTCLNGQRATRRIKWFNPDHLFQKIEGDNLGKGINCFAIMRITAQGFELLAVSAQLGIDMRGNHVLPNSFVADSSKEGKHSISIYSMASMIGRMEKTGEKLAAALNKQLNAQQHWFAPAGMKRGKLYRETEGPNLTRRSQGELQ